MKIPCLSSPMLLIKHRNCSRVPFGGKKTWQHILTRQQAPWNCWKLLITLTLPGGGSWEDGGWNVWMAGGPWPGSVAPGPEHLPSAAGSALLLASGRESASDCGSSLGLVSQRADSSSPAAPVPSPPWLLPAPLQLPVYVHPALPSHLPSGGETKHLDRVLFNFASVLQGSCRPTDLKQNTIQFHFVLG